MTEFPIVFIHIAKTAGTSLLMMLQKHIPIEASIDLSNADLRSREQFTAETGNGCIAGRNINGIRLISGHIPYWVCLCFNCRPITLLRDPVELIASFYYYSKNVLSSYEECKNLDFVKEAAGLSLEDFIALRAKNSVCKNFCGISDEESTHSVSLAKANLGSMLFGISEEFSLSSEMIFRQLGLPATAPIQVNVTPSKLEITGKQRLAIENHSPYDCELYDWAVSEFRRRYQSFYNLKSN